MIQALVYGNGGQESERAVMVLEACGQDVRQFLLGIDFTHKQFKAEFREEAEYPQVAIGLDQLLKTRLCGLCPVRPSNQSV